MTPEGRPSSDSEAEATGAVLTLVKALNVLEAIAETPGQTVAEVSVKVGLNRTTTHRLIRTLHQLDYLQNHPGGRGFEVGMKLLPLASQHLDNNRVRLAALPHLNTLAQSTGERVNLGVIFQGQVLYLAGVEKPTLPNMYTRFGKLAPQHCSSLGKAMLAHLPPNVADHILRSQHLVSQTPHTIIDPDILASDLAATRERGYAIDDQEHLPNVYCIAAPVFGSKRNAVAAVGISGSNRERVLMMSAQVCSCAEVISHILSS